MSDGVLAAGLERVMKLSVVIQRTPEAVRSMGFAFRTCLGVLGKMASGHVRDAKLSLEENDQKHHQAVQVATLHLESGGQSPSGSHQRMDMSERFAHLQRDVRTRPGNRTKWPEACTVDFSQFDS